MAFGSYLNFEKVSIEIIENAIAQMTDDNILNYDDDSIDEIKKDSFLINLRHGSIAAVFIVNLYETALNTILSKRLKLTGEDFLKASHALKLQIICAMYGIDSTALLGNHSFAWVKKIIKMRNDITHFKSNELGDSEIISSATRLPCATSKDSLTTLFSKTFVSDCYQHVMSFLRALCAQCGLVINPACEIIDCDARDELFEFIVTKSDCENSDRYGCMPY